MKSSILTTVILILVLSSCSTEDEPTDLTYYTDFLIETHVILKDQAQPFKADLTYYNTNGYNELVERYTSYHGDSNEETVTFIQSLKQYKKVGVRVKSMENISHLYITLYELGIGKNLYFQYQAETNEPFTLMYDFENKSHTITE